MHRSIMAQRRALALQAIDAGLTVIAEERGQAEALAAMTSPKTNDAEVAELFRLERVANALTLLSGRAPSVAEEPTSEAGEASEKTAEAAPKGRKGK